MDGEAFKSSFNQLIKGEVNRESIVNLFAHETLHLWNGMSMVSSEQNDWLVEGFTRVFER